MKCKNCGADIEEGMIFCNNCGAKIEEEINVKKNEKKQPFIPKKVAVFMVCFIIFFVVFSIAIVIGVIIDNKKNNDIENYVYGRVEQVVADKFNNKCYDKIRLGMEYFEIIKILNSEGDCYRTITSGSDVKKYYTWKIDLNQDSKVDVMIKMKFDNNKLIKIDKNDILIKQLNKSDE